MGASLTEAKASLKEAEARVAQVTHLQLSRHPHALRVKWFQSVRDWLM